MTNKEVLIQALQEFDEVGENNITDFIECPYVSSADCVNYQEGTDYHSAQWNDNCSECKGKWLLKEWEE